MSQKSSSSAEEDEENNGKGDLKEIACLVRKAHLNLGITFYLFLFAQDNEEAHVTFPRDTQNILPYKRGPHKTDSRMLST